jgi:hypothetical protein
MSDFNQNDLAALDRDIQGFPPQEKQRGWWSRNWLWFVPTLLLTLIILCCGCFTGIFATVVGQLRSEPYPEALELVRKDPRVIERLGEPVSDISWLPIGERQVEGDRGTAKLSFEVAGPKGKARVQYQARCVDGKWGFTQLEVVFGPSDKISIHAEADNDAPVWNSKAKKKSPETNAPPPEINMPTPGDIPEAPEKN